MTEPVRITSLYLKDFCGVETFKAEVGQVCIFKGENGSGKTSCLNAIRSVLEGGHDAALIRRGADKPEAKVVIELSSGGRITKTITPKESTLEVLSPDGGVIKGPATFVKQLVPTVEGTGSFDPIGFLDADGKAMAAFLLKTLPISFDASEVQDVLDLQVSGSIDLTRFNELREKRYAERTELNRQARDLEGTIADMEKSLPPDDATDWAAERDRVGVDIGTADEQIKTVTAQVNLEAEQTLQDKERELKQKIADLELELANFRLKVEQAKTEAILEQTRELTSRKATLAVELGTARQKAEEQSRAAGVRDAISSRREALQGHILRELQLTKMLKRTDELKAMRLKDLPIPGLDISINAKSQPSITIDGIPLEKLNRQRQLYVAIQAVKQAHGPMPLILLEVAELDDNHLQELAEACKEADIQLIMARWETGAPLEVIAA